MRENQFSKFLNKYYKKIDELVASYYTDSLAGNCATPDIARYLYEPLEHYAANGGKRHRPAVCLIGCAAVGGDPRLATSAAVAVEHFHTAALIHDDIADEGELRHGEPCLHLTQGVGLAINDGDLALSQVTGSVLKDDRLDDAVKVRVLNELVDMTTRTIEGQALDIGWARDDRWDITVDDYLTMARHKTAYYSVAVPLACGAIIGGGSDDQVEALRSFGMKTGLAFQLQDDALNLIGEREATKKYFRNDITEGKRTLMVVYALGRAGESETYARIARELREILDSHTSDPDELERAVKLLREAGAIDHARAYSLELTADAKRDLEGVRLDPRAKDLLLAMADFFVERLA